MICKIINPENAKPIKYTCKLLSSYHLFFLKIIQQKHYSSNYEKKYEHTNYESAHAFVNRIFVMSKFRLHV